MAFTDEQRQALNAKLRYRHVKMRSSNGAQLAYVEGWHAIAEANRIFGYESWDRQTLAPRCVWQEKQRGETACIYSTKVRITVRAGEVDIVREGIGTGVGRSTSAETAHDIALKAAETDATKRALATFGNPFGLALYDKDKRGVTKQHRRGRPKKTQRLLPPPTRLMLHHADGATHSYDSVAEVVTAALQCVQDVRTRSALYAFWEANLESLAAVSRAGLVNGEDPARVIGAALKARLHALAAANETSGLPASEASETRDVASSTEPTPSKDTQPDHPRYRRTAHPQRQAHPRSRRTSPSLPTSLASCAGDAPRKRITFASPSRAPSGSRCPMSSPCRCATAITTPCTRRAMSAPGGPAMASSIRSCSLIACGPSRIRGAGGPRNHVVLTAGYQRGVRPSSRSAGCGGWSRHAAKPHIDTVPRPGGLGWTCIWNSPPPTGVVPVLSGPCAMPYGTGGLLPGSGCLPLGGSPPSSGCRGTP